MTKKKLVYIWSLRNAAADQAGQDIAYKNGTRYMKSVLEYLVEALNETALGNMYSLEKIIYDDDSDSALDREKLKQYGFCYQHDKRWFYPPALRVQGQSVNDLLLAIPSTYRRYAMHAPQRAAGKIAFEKNLLHILLELKADLVVLDGLLIILDQLVRPDSHFERKIVNIHPGITCGNSAYQRRGAYATLDALYGARGKKVINWQTMETIPITPCYLTGASFHYVDKGIDSGTVIHDVLQTKIDQEDTILELRWNNFQLSLFPALHEGLIKLYKDKNYSTTSIR